MLYLNEKARQNTNEAVRDFYNTTFYPAPLISSQELQALETGKQKTTAEEFFEKHQGKVDKFYKRHRLGEFVSVPPATIGDFGCGTGNNALMLSRIFPDAQIDCYDISENALEHFERTMQVLGIKNIALYKTDIMNARFERTYDLVFSLGVMHHTSDIARTFENITSTLNPGGKGIFFLYNFYGKLYEVLTNRLVLILSQSGNKEQILKAGKLDRGLLSSRMAPLIDILGLHHGEKGRFALKHFIKPFLKPVPKAPRESNWDAFAHEIAHFVDVEFIHGLIQSFAKYDIWFGGEQGITLENTRNLLKRTNLQEYVSKKTDFLSLVKIQECLICPRSTYFYVQK